MAKKLQGPSRLGNSHHPHHPGLCKIFRFGVKLVNLIYCHSFVFLAGNSSDNCEEHYFQSIVSEILAYFKDILKHFESILLNF